MFERIVVGVDGADGGRDAIALGRLLAGAGTRVVLVHAYPGGAVPDAPFRHDAETLLEGEAEGWDVELRPVADSSPARAIHQVAEREGADLIVTGSSHRGVIGRVLIGSVTRATLQGAPCAVAVAPAGFRDAPKPVHLVGVGYDGGPESRAAFAFAEQLARDADGELRLVTALPEPVAFAPNYAYTYDWSAVLEARRESAQKELAELVEGTDVPATADVRDGVAATVLEDLAHEVDVLVAGSRGWGALKRVVLGSTTDRLAQHAESTLIVVPSPVEAEDEREPAGQTARAG